MRLYEIADAEEQLGLLRLVLDNTWAAIAQQVEQQRRAKAERKLASRAAPRVRKPAPPRVPTPPAKPANAAQPGQVSAWPAAVIKPKSDVLRTVKPKPTVAKPIKPLPVLQPKFTPSAHPKPISIKPIQPKTTPNRSYFGKNIDDLEK